MRKTPVEDYLEEVSTTLTEETYGRLSDTIYETVCEFDEEVAQLKAENAKLRELVRRLRVAYVGAINECESLESGLVWEYSGSVDADIAKMAARYEALRHRFDAELYGLGIEDEP